MNDGGTSEKKHRYDVNLCGRKFEREEKLFRMSFLVWFANATWLEMSQSWHLQTLKTGFDLVTNTVSVLNHFSQGLS